MLTRRMTSFFCIVVVVTSLLMTPAARPVVLVDSPDVKLVDSTTTSTEAVGKETSVFVHPTNYRIVLVSLISQGGSTAGCSGWVSQDGGLQLAR